MPTTTFLWHDYETFGVSPRRDRPAQFAAIRTDAALEPVGDPIELYCRPAPDYLPDPAACLITGITPQTCLARGLPECEFAAAIERALAEPGTVGVGYNTIRFDDEVTRFLLWRNLRDPYAREWQNECGRWDILDLMRCAYALRPDGIAWPANGEGRVSFRLEDLCAANGILHEAAHDALSDVRATIGLARLIRRHQPRLFDFCYELRKRERAAAEIGVDGARPFLHVSGMFPVERGCLAVMWPLARHPTNRNEVIAWDLASDPSELLELDAETIRARLFAKAGDLPPAFSRLPIKTIHLNRSPVVIGNLKTLTPALAERWGLDLAQVQKHRGIAEAARFAAKLQSVWPDVFKRQSETAADVDEDLYGGFVGNRDRGRLNRLLALDPAELARAPCSFEDPRLEELVFRFRARNHPSHLSAEESQRWEEHRAARLYDGAGGARTVAQLSEAVDRLFEDADEKSAAILEALYDYAESIAPQRVAGLAA